MDGGDFGDYSYTYGSPPCPWGCGGRVYVVNHQETWVNGTPLMDLSSDDYETVAWGNFFFEMAWPKNLTPGTYDLILDLDVSGYYYVWTNITNPDLGEERIIDPIWTIYVTESTEPGIRVDKTASPTKATPGTDVTFTIDVTNTGDCTLNPVRVEDTLPAGMSYVSSDPEANETEGTITWYNVGPLDPLNSTTITLVAHIDSGASETLNNTANATGTPPTGENVTGSDTAEVEVEEQPPTPTAQVPAFTSVGLIALIGLLSVIAAISIKRRK